MRQSERGIHTYRGRTLEELVPRIREDLGDDAVIVGRREARSGGFAGFFAKREIELDVRAAAEERPEPLRDDSETPAARAFRERLEAAQARQVDVVAGDAEGLQAPGDVDVHDLFPPRGDGGYAEMFEAPQGVREPGQSPAVGDWNAAGDADVISISSSDRWQTPAEASAAAPAPDDYERELDAVLEADLGHDDADEQAPPAAEHEQPAGLPSFQQPTVIFDSLAAALADEPVAAPAPAPVLREVEPPEELDSGPFTPTPVEWSPTVAETVVTHGAPPGASFALARSAARRMIERGLAEDLAERAAAEAAVGLMPFEDGADIRALVARALARHLPAAELRSGPGRIAVIGANGAGRTRSVARLAAAYATQGELPVTVVALRQSDGGDELRRLLAPYDSEFVDCSDGGEAAARLATAGDRIVLVDTPAITARDHAAITTLAADLEALGVSEVHLVLPATTAVVAATELLDAAAALRPSALVVTRCDETFQLGPLMGLSIDRDLPISYVSHGQAVDAGITAGATERLAAELLC